MIRGGVIEGLRSGIRAAAHRIEQRYAAESGADLLIYCGFRSFAEQAVLYRKGRTLSAILAKADELKSKHGREDLAEVLLRSEPQPDPKIVTNAGPGQSAHNYGEAFDAVPLVGGKPVWLLSDPLYQLYGQISEEEGLEWAGNWKTFREGPHSQTAGFDWRSAILSSTSSQKYRWKPFFLSPK